MSDRRGGLDTILLSPEALGELKLLGLHRPEGEEAVVAEGLEPVEGRGLIPKRAISASEVLNEAYEYSKPSSFSRGIRVELPGTSMLYLSGTASVDEDGVTVYPGDFEAQCLRTFRNLTKLLVAEKASWHDVVRTTCYLILSTRCEPYSCRRSDSTRSRRAPVSRPDCAAPISWWRSRRSP